IMVETRRAKLKDLKLQDETHMGLWLERFFQLPELERNTLANASPKEIKKALGAHAKEHFREVQSIARSPLYEQFFSERWKPTLESFDFKPQEIELKRFALGLGEASVLQVGF